MKVLLTGAAGFLGWHTEVRLRALTEHEVVRATRDNWTQLPQLAADADTIIHVAGVNRGLSDQVREDNVAIARDVATALRTSGSVQRVVYANSIQAESPSPYGSGKAKAGAILDDAAAAAGSSFVDVRLPNLFGEGGRPDYNSFVATFVHKIVAGEKPAIADRLVPLLHVQDAAQTLIEGLTTSLLRIDPPGVEASVQDVYDTLVEMKTLYDTGEIPPLLGPLDVALFNTLRWAMFPQHYPIALTRHADRRGELVETVKTHGGQGQTFVSTTRPGITRGDHFHLEKIERFVVIKGTARISLRKVSSDEVISFDVCGDEPAVIDMPTMWVHNITNIGDEDVITLFWTHTIFDPNAPDTFWEPVSMEASE